jgi:hypothetical protein
LQFPLQPACFRVIGAAQIIDPHGRVDDHHRTAYSRTRVRRA